MECIAFCPELGDEAEDYRFDGDITLCHHVRPVLLDCPCCLEDEIKRNLYYNDAPDEVWMLDQHEGNLICPRCKYAAKDWDQWRQHMMDTIWEFGDPPKGLQ